MAAPAATEVTEGPVLSYVNKRLRNLRKKYNRILQMEETLAQGKTLNKEQEEVLRSKPAVAVLIDEYEKLRQPLFSAVQEELALASASASASASATAAAQIQSSPVQKQELSTEKAVEDLLNLLYFGSLFDVMPQSDFTSTMLTRTHERECCLTYDYVTDEATDLLGERDLDLISSVGGLLISRPLHSTLSHKNALRSCVEHAKLWLANSDQPIQPGSDITYTGLRERLNKILASDYFTTTPEMKAPIEVAAAAGKYAPCQVPLPETDVPESQEEVASIEQYEQKDEDVAYLEEEPIVEQSSPIEETPKDDSDSANEVVDSVTEQDPSKPVVDVEEQNETGEAETKEYVPRRGFHNQRGGSRGGGGGVGGGGRRGYVNGRGNRGRGGGGGYQNGRSQYFDNNYYPRNYYNSRGRGGGRSGGGTAMYNHHEGYVHGGHGSAEVEPGR
ncbi:hypothetical protein H6P81_000254 [Aristolochia fimbriata]|uniref:Glycine-rich protein n=1 Tax=Aristolochia fimbriata TaxID=158543 RepID=A0AAV7F7D7_ARIFI|nr:hypothetical protein H6P81_000254 [Aristolochia fimbriata]